jgi:hypothetical protein
MSSIPAGLQVCYSDLSGIGGLDFSQTLEIKNSWDTFRRIEIYNIGISTARDAGDKTLKYYTFVDNQERMNYVRGLNLHNAYIGFNSVVQKN